MSSKANRRASIEVQQMVQWKHQQNLEEIKALKANSTLPPPPSPATSNTGTPSVLSKLAARKQRSNFDGTSIHQNHTPSRNESSKLNDDAGNKARQQFVGFGQSATPQELFGKNNQITEVVSNNTNKSDLDALLKEKQHWLRVIHEDNSKMATILKDLREAKVQLSKKMDELDVARRDLVAGRSAQEDDIEVYLQQESDLSTTRRDMCVPSAHLSAADELLRDLLAVTGQFRINQAEVRGFFYKTIRQTVSSFVAAAVASEERESARELYGEEDEEANTADGDGEGAVDDSSWRHHLTVLRALASTSPSNVRAAEGVAASAASAVIHAVGERTVDLLQLHQSALEKRQQQSLRDEIRALQKDNAELKSSLAQMRKSNVQLRMKAANTALLLPSSAPSREAFSRADSGAEGALGAEGSVAESKKSDRDAHFAEEEGLSEDETAVAAADEARLLGGATSPTLLQSGDQLPKVVERYLLRELALHAQQVVEGHPLADGLGEGVVATLTKDISKEVQGIASAAFFAFMHHRQAMVELPTCLLDGTVSSIDDPLVQQPSLGAEELVAVEQVKEAVDHVLQVSSVHTELSALVTLYLTYLHCRPNKTGESTLDMPGASSRGFEGDGAVGEQERGGRGSLVRVPSSYSHMASPSSKLGARRASGALSTGTGMGGAEQRQQQQTPTLKSNTASSSSPLPRYMQPKAKR